MSKKANSANYCTRDIEFGLSYGKGDDEKCFFFMDISKISKCGTTMCGVMSFEMVYLVFTSIYTNSLYSSRV